MTEPRIEVGDFTIGPAVAAIDAAVPEALRYETSGLYDPPTAGPNTGRPPRDKGPLRIARGQAGPCPGVGGEQFHTWLSQGRRYHLGRLRALDQLTVAQLCGSGSAPLEEAQDCDRGDRDVVGRISGHRVVMGVSAMDPARQLMRISPMR
ncbi:hypothetical protein ACFY2M_17500 [Streptomyces sp. NPDC001276]|uniref:hypothetical protein n=1 Tax=Streptomyces sp. NPDC001276 TaxID=3364555 RepID=UPI00369FE267